MVYEQKRSTNETCMHKQVHFQSIYITSKTSMLPWSTAFLLASRAICKEYTSAPSFCLTWTFVREPASQTKFNSELFSLSKDKIELTSKDAWLLLRPNIQHNMKYANHQFILNKRVCHFKVFLWAINQQLTHGTEFFIIFCSFLFLFIYLNANQSVFFNVFPFGSNWKVKILLEKLQYK